MKTDAEGGGSGAARDIALVITSCRRFDLLERTVDSMRPWISGFGQRILVEDSGETPAQLDRWLEDGFSVLLNGRQIGQHASIDRAYATVETPYIVHCEDDWRFSREPDLASAIRILERGFPLDRSTPKENTPPAAISCVCFYDTTTKEIFDQNKYREHVVNGTRYRWSPHQRNKYNSFTFTPSLMRRDLWSRYGPWQEFLSEGSIARFLQRRGYSIATQQPGVVSHIGGGRRVPDSRRRSTPIRALRQWLRKGV